MSQSTPSVGSNGDGDAVIVLGYDDDVAFQSAVEGLSRQVEPTPDPGSDDTDDAGGIVRRANEFRTRLGPVALETIALSGMEISKAVTNRADDLYQNKFPLLEPRFTRKCEECGAEFDEDIDTCSECEAPTRQPSAEQRTKAEQFFESVNKEGQSLRALYEMLAHDAGRLGVWTHIVKKEYGVLNGQVIEEAQELVRADPKRVKPVVDENGRIGGCWWACPVHRDVSDLDTEPGHCEQCGAELREVYYAEVENLRDTTPSKVYFDDEVIDHAPWTQFLAGRDGLSPVANLWKPQAILEWMRTYAAGFYDQNNEERYPGTMLIIHTSNKQAVDKQLARASDDEDEDPYANGILYNEVPDGANGSSDAAQVIDLMNDEILGQSDNLKKDYKRDIRNVYGQTDAQDSELSDAGGLNNEGMQVEIQNADTASFQAALKDGPLRKLMDVLGYTDWQVGFVPPKREQDDQAPTDAIQAAARAEEAGIAYEIEDGRLRVVDTDGPVHPEPTPAEAGGADGGAPGGPASFAEESQDSDIDIGLATEIVTEALDSYSSGWGYEAARELEGAHAHLFWESDEDADDVAEQATSASGGGRAPYFNDRDRVPEFVQDLISDSIEGGSVHEMEGLSSRQHAEFENMLEENLTQPQGWSVDSVATDIEQRFDVSSEKAHQLAEDQIQNVLTPARELGYEIEGDLDERRFYFAGPDHPTICDACRQLLQETNPAHGGTPIRLQELRDRVDDLNNQHYDHDNRLTKLHIGCKHTVVEDMEARP